MWKARIGTATGMRVLLEPHEKGAVWKDLCSLRVRGIVIAKNFVPQ